MKAGENLRDAGRVNGDVLACPGGDGGHPGGLPVRQKAPPPCVRHVPGDEPDFEHRPGQQLQTRVAGQRGETLARGDAVAVLVHCENGDLELIDEAPQLRLAFGVRAVVPRQFLQVEEAAFERARPPRGDRR